MFETTLRTLTTPLLTLALCVGMSACDTAQEQDFGGEQTFRPGGGIGSITVNTSNWVSAGARDIYEFDKDGAWGENSFGFETRLKELTFNDPQFGWITTDPATPPAPGQARVELSSPESLEVTVFPPGPGAPITYRGQQLIGLELGLRVKYDGGPEYWSRVRVVEVATNPVGGELYELHKVNLQTNETFAPICEADSNGDRHARIYGDVRIDAESGAVTNVMGVAHIACSAAAPGKSALYGYLPDAAPESFMLANRVIRADYCADGYPYTYPGNSLLIRDNFSPGQQGQTLGQVYESLEGYALEAMWGVEGVLCVDTPRVDTLTRGDMVCPIKRLENGQVAHNWTPPPCDTFVDPNPGALRFYSLTEIDE